MVKIDKQEFEVKKNKIENCKNFLKKNFIGIDKVIDDLLDYIQIWYLMPEILNRPIIVNLWGMTGVGKTDLVRKMVSFLEFQDRFTEIELSNIDNSSYFTSVSQILTNNDINDENPKILLFDEIQRFNTINPDGTPIPQTKFMDFWELLSDGRLSRKTRDNGVDGFILNFLFRKKDNEKKKNRGETIEENFTINPWEAKEIKSFLGINDLEEIK